MPDNRRLSLAAIALAFLMIGCRSEEPSFRPAPSPVLQPAPTFALTTLSGAVFEHTFDRQGPLSGVRVLLLGYPPSVWGETWREFETDRDGRFLAFSLPAPSYVNVRLESAHVVPCAGSGFWIDAPTAAIEIHAVMAAGVPPSHPKAGVSGVVYEQLPGGIVPVADARVDLWGEEDQHFGSVTGTDSQGRFGFCQVAEALTLSVVKAGYVARWGVDISGGSPVRVDVELIRESSPDRR